MQPTDEVDWKIAEPERLDEFISNQFDPNKLNIMTGCSLIVNRVYENRFINEAGFLTEDLPFSGIVREDMQEMV